MSNAFVILEHSISKQRHYDLMLERGGVLETWQMSRQVNELEQGESIDAKKLADHRLAYLDYEGPISKNRGQVKRVDKGSYDLLESNETGRIIRLKSKNIQGTFELRQDPMQKNWTLRLQTTNAQ